MATYDNTYSRVVAWLRILLPVVALALLSTMFLISRSIDPTRSIPMVDIDPAALTQEQRISGPNFSGVTRDGAAITFSAASAQPVAGQPNQFRAEGLSARIDTPDGGSVSINAAAVVFDGTADRLTLSGGVSLETSTDYVIAAQGLSASLDQTDVSTDGAVKADGPLGMIHAGGVHLGRQGGADGPYLLVFKDGVKLVYDPKEQGSR